LREEEELESPPSIALFLYASVFRGLSPNSDKTQTAVISMKDLSGIQLLF